MLCLYAVIFSSCYPFTPWLSAFLFNVKSMYSYPAFDICTWDELDLQGFTPVLLLVHNYLTEYSGRLLLRWYAYVPCKKNSSFIWKLWSLVILAICNVSSWAPETQSPLFANNCFHHKIHEYILDAVSLLLLGEIKCNQQKPAAYLLSWCFTACWVIMWAHFFGHAHFHLIFLRGGFLLQLCCWNTLCLHYYSDTGIHNGWVEILCIRHVEVHYRLY